VPLVFVEGDPRYFGRLDFTPGAARGFSKPSLRIPDDAFEVAALTAYEYLATFWVHDSVGLRDL
jgi:putative acetyltransferase